MSKIFHQDVRFFLLSWPLWSCLIVVFLILLLLQQLSLNRDVLAVHDVTFHEIGSATETDLELLNGKPISLPHNWSRVGFTGNNAWYLAKLKLNVPPNRLWGIYIPSVGANAAVYLNGHLLGNGGKMTAPLTRNDYRPLYFTIPNGTLKPAVNEIAINLVSDPAGRGFISPLFLGPDQTLGPTYKRSYFIRVTIVQFIAISLVVSMFYVGVLAFKTRDSIYAYFAATLGSSWLFDTAVLYIGSPISGWIMDWIKMQGTGWMVVFIILFLHRFLYLSRPRIERALLFWAISGAVLTAIVPLKWFYLLNSYYWDILTILWGIYALITAFMTTKKSHSIEHWSITLSVLVLLGAGIRDWVLYTGKPEGFDGTMMLYAVLYPLIIFAWVLLQRFTSSLQKADTLNRELEHRVQKKEAELAINYKKISHAQKQQALTEERERIMSDMHDGIGGQLVAAISSANSNSQDNLVDNLETALADLRLMIDSFEPVDDDLGTVLGLIRMRLEKRLRNHSLEFVWRVEDIPEIPGLGPHKVLHVMRILEEAVTNVIKHAKATKIVVAAYTSIKEGIPGVAVDIIDNGEGIPSHGSKGYGLNNMQRRAQIVGGILIITAAHPGTKVQLWLPTDRSSENIEQV